ncbi:MAG: hypothetical protein H6601_05425 [Flavobacteriales bacterium]|nr:hypothetical protein [Flavobacteriales bacterium]
MKTVFRNLLFVLSVATIGACNTNDPDLVDPILGTYVGAMNISDPSFQSTAVSVVVTSVSTEVVKISPQGGHGTQWTAHLTNVAGVFTCISCVSQNQITFTKVNGVYNLSYNYNSNNEQFSGQKQ